MCPTKGPKVTIEIQFAQDDFNFLGYKLGERIQNDELDSIISELQLRGLKEFVEKLYLTNIFLFYDTIIRIPKTL